jgi:hypothetical protein
MLLPKIIYNSTTLTFSYPPVQKPGTPELETSREDSITLTGVKQSIHVRTDTFFTLQMDSVPQADLTNWAAFMAWALQGNSFDYYPDATSGTHTAYTLEDTDWLPKRAFFGYVKFSLRFRKFV